MLSKLHEKFEVIDHNHILNRETRAVTKNNQVVKLLKSFTPVPSISTPGLIVYKAKTGMKYRDIIIGGAAPARSELPNIDVINALQILEALPDALPDELPDALPEVNPGRIDMSNEKEVVIEAMEGHQKIEPETVSEIVVSNLDEETEGTTSRSRPVKTLPQLPRIFNCKGDDYIFHTSIIVGALNEASVVEFLQNETDFKLSTDEGAIVECDPDMEWIVQTEYDGYESYEFSNEPEFEEGQMQTVESRQLPNNISDHLDHLSVYNTVTLLFGEYDLNDEYTIGVFNHLF